MKVQYPTQIIRTTVTHHEWRKALSEAEADGRWDDYADLKAKYADWREARSAAASALGSIRSPRKAAASRENGKRGGRPRATPGTVNTETKRFAARVARVARYCKTPTTGDTTLGDWLAEGYTYEGSAREVARQWDALSAG